MTNDTKRAADGEAAGEEAADAKKARIDGHKLNANFALDKEHEAKSFKEIIKHPPGALQGLAAGKADKMLLAFKVHTIEELANWKHYRVAKAIATLAELEEGGARADGSLMNINEAIDASHEKASFKEMLDLPPSALQGLADWTDNTLKELKIHTVKDLAEFKYCNWAAALVTAAQFESTEFEHK